MDPKLAEIYGTNQTNEVDLEKLAAAELADGLANDDQIDTDGMTEEDLEAVAQDVLNGGTAEEGGEGGEEPQDESQEKLAEADYLGRVMAHSYVNELREIEKTAAKKEGPMTGTESAKRDATRAKHGPDATTSDMVKNKADSAKKAVVKGGKRAGELLAGGAKGTVGEMAGHRAGNKKIISNLFGKGGMRREALKSMGARGGAAAGVAGLGYGAYKSMRKQSSAVDTLVEQRMQEILEASGLEISNEQEQEKVSEADPREVLANEVDQRAWAALAEYGVVPADQE